MKKGLVLEGGALRSLFSAGVMDVMMENGITFDGLIGVSAGSAFGCNYKSNQPGRVIRYNKKLANDWRYASFRSWVTTGDYFGGEYDYHYMPAHIDKMDTKTFTDNPMEFYLVCTDLETGKAVYKKIDKFNDDNYDEIAEWFRASASMPIVSKIVNINGQKVLDGGIADSIPLEYFQRIGYGKNIVVTTQPEGFQKEPNKFIPIFRILYRKYPAFIKASAERHIMYNKQLEYIKAQEMSGNTLVIRPKKKLAINHMTKDTKLMDEVYQEGRTVASERIDEIINFMSE